MRRSRLLQDLKPFFLRWLQQGAEAGLTVGEGPGIDVQGGYQVGLGGDKVLLYDSGGSPVAEYDTIAAALAASADGDHVQAQAGTYNESFTVPAGREFSGRGEATIITGQVTVAGRARQFHIVRNVDQAGAAVGVQDAAGATGYVRGVKVSVTNATGPAHAVAVTEGGELHCHDVEVATSGSTGYGYYVESGTLYVNEGRARSEDQTTAPYYVA